MQARSRSKEKGNGGERKTSEQITIRYDFQDKAR